MHPAIETIFQAFEHRGSERYGTDNVTQLQHALQSAQLAIRDGASASLVTAALLHDIGHILTDRTSPENHAKNLDDGHESTAYEFLKNHFGRVVADPVRLHVVAKRYLCTTEPAYLDLLSPASLTSYKQQGGKLPADERQQFEAEPHFREAIRLRRWDDAAKDASAVTPPIKDFTSYLEASLVA